MIRGDRRSTNGTKYGLRLWENDDLVPRPNDVFQERLYCIRWVGTQIHADKRRCEETISVHPRSSAFRHYLAPNNNDLKREEKVLELLQKRFHEWQEKGYIPSRSIEPGDNTDQPIRERGWTRWHHLFNPRQLLTLGYLFEKITLTTSKGHIPTIGILLGSGKCCDYNAELSRWHPHSANEKSEQVFSNQALNTLFNYGVRTSSSLHTVFFTEWSRFEINKSHTIKPIDTRSVSAICDIWITDPPYADAVNYHELSEFFLAWYEKHIIKLFPDWYIDSKRALAITGRDENFRKSMVECYQNLAKHMPDNGIQIVMFTHQDAGVWADLALILWASCLRVTAAWCIATETDSALKEGNYVQGTVLLVLRKQTSDDTAFLDELYPKSKTKSKSS